MENIAKICIALTVTIIVLFCVYLFIFIKKKIETQALLNEKKRTEILPYKLLRINFSKRMIMHRVCLPYTALPDSNCYNIDLLIVCNGGILMITVKDLKGTVENPFRGDWRQFYNNQITQFKNPFEESNNYARALCNLLKRDKMINIPIRSVVCYLDKKTRFKNRMEQLLVADKLVPYIKDMSKNRFLSRMEMENVLFCIRQSRRNVKKPVKNKPEGIARK